MSQAISDQVSGQPPAAGKFKLFLLETRAPFFTATLVPIVLGGIIAWASTGNFHWGYFVLTLLGGLCLHAGTNIANDYWDHKSSNDEINEEYVRPFTGGSRMIQRGLLSPKEVLGESLVFFIAGSIIGLFLVWTRGLPVLVLGVIGIFSGFFYCAPPVRLSYRGVGEAIIGLNFGPLMVFGTYWVQTQRFDWLPIIASVPVGILIAAVIYINEFQDCAADKAVGRKHMIARWGKEKGAAGYAVIMFAVYAWIAAWVITGLLSRWLPLLEFLSLPVFCLLAFITLPKAIQAVRTAREFHSDSQKLVPANALTIMSHLQGGIWMMVGFSLWVVWNRVYPLLLN
ncbi:MAG: prenyltransferase [Dehalococcoidia bacterium]|nr:prenyltransferase [Dehalococcoidia bacterium]